MCSSRPLFASACCGGTFTPGTGQDNIVDLRSELRALSPDDKLTVSTAPDHSRDLGPENAHTEQLPEAYRDGTCPACGAERPLLELTNTPESTGCGTATGGLGSLLWRGLAVVGELSVWFLVGAGIAALAEVFSLSTLRELLADL